MFDKGFNPYYKVSADGTMCQIVNRQTNDDSNDEMEMVNSCRTVEFVPQSSLLFYFEVEYDHSPDNVLSE